MASNAATSMRGRSSSSARPSRDDRGPPGGLPARPWRRMAAPVGPAAARAIRPGRAAPRPAPPQCTRRAAACRQHVGVMASDLADLMRRRGPAPDSLAEVVAQSYGYRGDSQSYDDLQNADLVRVIERRKGLPVALSILYLHIARAQGWPAEGLAFPAHFLIRVGIEGARPLVDPFHHGLVRDHPTLASLSSQVVERT